MKKVATQFPLINENAAGIDIGTEMIFVAVAGLPVRRFPTYTADLLEACCYLKANHVTTVAMEATGVYWMPLYDYWKAIT